MTRVLFLTESFHPTLGGGETHIRRLGAALVRAGDAATVVTRRADPAWPAEEALDGLRVLRVGPPGPARTGKYRMLPAAFRAARRELARHDVLVVRGTRVLGLPGLLAARTRGRPVVLQPEINGELSGEAFTWGKPLGARRPGRGVCATRSPRATGCSGTPTAFVAMSRQIQDEMGAAGIPRERIRLLPHGVDVERFRPADPTERQALRARLGLPEGVLAVYSGRLLRGKGLETLVDAMAAPALPEALRLVLLGSGEGQLDVEPELRRRVSERGLGERVVFAGRVENVADYLRAGDLFVFPSLFEALGIALVEAAACGLPAVASRTGGIVDVVDHDRSGVLVPPGSAPALAAALATLASDPGRRAAMGRAARGVAVSRFDERDVLERYRALFSELSSRRS